MQRPSLSEFAQAVMPVKIQPWQRRLLEAIERGDKLVINPNRGRASSRQFMREQAREFNARMHAP